MLKNLLLLLLALASAMVVAFGWGVEYGYQSTAVPLCKEPAPARSLPSQPRDLGTALV